MTDNLEVLQKALDNRPAFPLAVKYEGSLEQWFVDFEEKFAAYCAELELPVGEWLTKNAKTTEDIFNLYKEQFNKGWLDILRDKSSFEQTMKGLRKEWVSEDVRTFFLAKERSLRKRFQDLFDTIPIEMEKVGRKYEVYSVGTKKQWIAWLVKYAQVFDETFSISKSVSKWSKELLLGKGLPLCEKCKGPMKVLSIRDDGCRYFECPKCGQTMGEETEEWFKNQESSDSLSPEEIRDVEASEKEFAEGKCETFKNAKDLIADLHKGRKKKGSVKEGSK